MILGKRAKDENNLVEIFAPNSFSRKARKHLSTKFGSRNVSRQIEEFLEHKERRLDVSLRSSKTLPMICVQL